MRLAPVFQDHAVLQRDIPIPVWGEASPETRITVHLAGHEAASTTGGDGRWIARLPALPAGGPHELRVVADDGSPAMTLRDILIGEVWVCSGQSNMEFRMRESDASGAQCHGADFPEIRLLTVSTPVKTSLQTAIDGRWTLCTPESIAQFSAIAGWFGRALHTELHVPVGLIANAWGGTRIQAWLSREALMTDPAGREEIAAYEPALHSVRSDVESFATADEWFRARGPESSVNLGLRDEWHSPDFDDAAWPFMQIPSRWQDAGHHFSGIFWFRRRIEIPPHWKGHDLAIHLGSIDKHDETYVNAHLVGGIGWENKNSWCTPRHYKIPASLVADASEIVIAVRVRSHLYHGGLTGPAQSMAIHPANCQAEAIPLAGPWRFAVEQNWGSVTPPPLLDRAPGGPNAPYAMFASRLQPLIPYGIRGFIWYQGESNAGEALLYRRLLPLMIADWRRVWGQGDLPFLQVQLANFHPPLEHPAESDWAELRAAQSAALRDPHVGMAVAIDVGEADDIHPKDKKSVGLRLSRWALARVYGLAVLPSGPLFRSATPVENRLRLAFEYSTGLATRDGGPVRQLAIAGPDRIFIWAESAIVGEQLEVWHPDILAPAAVRYAWATNPEGCNLVNSEGLPASPFDTDNLAQP
jgi:sialate O-acetylesterase